MKTTQPSGEHVPGRLPDPGEVVAERYLVVGELGQGAMGAVYRARDLETGEFVALKLLKPEAMLIPGVRERFAREARMSAAFSHPNAVATLAFGFHASRPGGDSMREGLPFLVMELLQGQALSGVLYTRRLSFKEATWVIAEVLRCLAKAHRKNLVHRDLKPDNIFICASSPPQVKLLDFGLAKTLHADANQATQALLTLPGMSGGTPAYMAPEQAGSLGETKAAADVYAMGCIAYHLFAGRMPFEGALGAVLRAHAVTEPPPLPGELAGQALEGVIHKAMAKHPMLRYPDASSMLEAFQRAVAQPVGGGAMRRAQARHAPQQAAPQQTAAFRRDDLTRTAVAFGATVTMSRDAAPRQASPRASIGSTVSSRARAEHARRARRPMRPPNAAAATMTLERRDVRPERAKRPSASSATMTFDRRELSQRLKEERRREAAQEATATVPPTIKGDDEA